MGYLGKQPTAIPLSGSDIVDDSIESADIKAGTIVDSDVNASAAIATSKVSGAVTSIASHGLATSATTDTTNATNIGSGTLPDARFPATLPATSGVNLTALNATNLGSGTVADARISESSVSQHVAAVDLTSVRQDIAMLALYNAVSDNRAAYNLPYSFIDQFEDDTGITTTTDVTRNTTDEYVSSISTVSGAYSSDGNTLLLLHGEESPFTDSSSTGHAVTTYSSTRSSTQAKFGTYSIASDGPLATHVSVASHANWAITNFTNYTIDYWVYFTTMPTSYAATVSRNSSNGHWSNYIGSAGNIKVGLTGTNSAGTANGVITTGSWQHVAVVKTGSTTVIYKNGVSVLSTTTAWYGGGTSSPLTIGSDNYGSGSNNSVIGYMDEVRMSDVARWSTGFTPNADSTSASATGTLISDTQTAPASTTKMSGVILYKDAYGTATLGTHLKIYLSANNGSNWTEVPSYGAVTPLFSAGVKMVRLGETTVTSGTAPVMKAVWASQSDSSLETHLYGWAMNY